MATNRTKSLKRVGSVRSPHGAGARAAVQGATKAAPHGRGRSKDAAALARIQFVEALIDNGFNAKAAAISVGFSPKTAEVKGSQLLREVKGSGLLELRLQAYIEALRLDAEENLRGIVAIARTTIKAVCDGEGRPLPNKLIDAQYAPAVESRKWGRYGPEIKLRDSLRARDMLAKILGQYKEDNRQKVDAIAALLEAIAPDAGLVPVP
jgi:phage terminase small subunit